MYEATISDDSEYNIPDNFTSRTSEVLQVYLKSLGIRMQSIIDETEFIGEEEHLNETVIYELGNSQLMCTRHEMYYLSKLHKTYKQYLRKHPNTIDDVDEVWEYILENLPFKKKELTENIINMFKDSIEAFSSN